MTGNGDPWFRRTKHGLEIFVRLTPRSSGDAVEGLAEATDGRRHLKARVRAIPEGGAANKALEKLLANWLGIARRDVSVVSGFTSRLKSVAVACDENIIAAKLRSRESGD